MDISRREFVKNLTLFGAGIALAGSMSLSMTGCAESKKVENGKYICLKKYDEDTILGYIYEGYIDLGNGKNNVVTLHMNDGESIKNLNQTLYMKIEDEDIKEIEQYFDGEAHDDVWKVIYRENGEFKTLYCDEFEHCVDNNDENQRHVYTFYKDKIVVKNMIYEDDFLLIGNGMRPYLDPYTTSNYGTEDKTTQIVKKKTFTN